MATDPKAFLGVGWSYPPAVDPDGTIALAAHEEDVRQAVRIILGTEPGERVSVSVRFTAPEEPLSCRSVWQMVDADSHLVFPWAPGLRCQVLAVL